MKRLMTLALLSMLATAAWALNESEPNEGIPQANPFTIGDTLVGGLPEGFGAEGSSPPLDYWSFSATAGIQYTFNGTVVNGGIQSLDIALDLENNSTILASADNGAGNQPETLNWTAPSSGTFYLVVWEATGTINAFARYNVTTSQGAPSNVSDWVLY